MAGTKKKTATAATNPGKSRTVSTGDVRTEVLYRALPAKDVTHSKTIWLSAAGFIGGAGGLILHITNTGYFSDANLAATAMGISLMLTGVAQFINRFYTDRPVTV